MKAYQAHANGCTVTRDTPRAAAISFFETFPNKRKCNVVEGKTDGNFFVVSYGRPSLGQWPSSWRDVTKKTADTLPSEVQS